jgi:hypothetical protein
MEDQLPDVLPTMLPSNVTEMPNRISILRELLAWGKGDVPEAARITLSRINTPSILLLDFVFNAYQGFVAYVHPPGREFFFVGLDRPLVTCLNPRIDWQIAMEGSGFIEVEGRRDGELYAVQLKEGSV